MIESTDRARFLSLIEENKGIIYKVANAYCRDADDRKDVVQEIILQLWRALPSYDSQFKLSTWMYRIALNVAISFYRRDKKKKERETAINSAILELGEVNDETERESNIHLLQQCIHELKELDRALMLLYLDDKSYKEMADIMAITETNVATKISRTKEKLKQRITTLTQ